MAKYKYLLFDAANTLIHKPDLFVNMHKVLHGNGYDVQMETLRKNHKLISEIIKFPDVTNEEFYKKFNAELLYSLGIIPSNNLLSEIFKSCTYLPWVVFDDTSYLREIDIEKGIVSNFNNSLANKINQLFGNLFKDIAISENYGVGKPDLRFYEMAIKNINAKPHEILYLGDSLKLDVEPATQLGIDAMLIDRDNVFPYYKKRISSFKELIHIVEA